MTGWRALLGVDALLACGPLRGYDAAAILAGAGYVGAAVDVRLDRRTGGPDTPFLRTLIGRLDAR